MYAIAYLMKTLFYLYHPFKHGWEGDTGTRGWGGGGGGGGKVGGVGSASLVILVDAVIKYIY